MPIALTDLSAPVKSGVMDRLWSELPDFWWSVDLGPGDVNVGLSQWTGPVCFTSGHTTPNEAVDHLIDAIHFGGLKLLVYEKFNLQGDKMAQQQGSEFLTSQMIGAMRHVCRRAGIPTVGYRPVEHKKLFKQPAFRPPARPDREWRSYGHGGHAKDSECLGEYYVRTIMLKGRGY